MVGIAAGAVVLAVVCIIVVVVIAIVKKSKRHQGKNEYLKLIAGDIYITSFIIGHYPADDVIGRYDYSGKDITNDKDVAKCTAFNNPMFPAENDEY